MAMAAAPQEPVQAGGISRANSFSPAAVAAAASMASIFPHQMLFHQGSCKVAASAPPVLTVDTVESSLSQFEAEEIYGFFDESPPLCLQSTPVKNIGAGLANLGNTCFLNSVLQCLTYTPPLAAHLQGGSHTSTCKFSLQLTTFGLAKYLVDHVAASCVCFKLKVSEESRMGANPSRFWKEHLLDVHLPRRKAKPLVICCYFPFVVHSTVEVKSLLEFSNDQPIVG